MTEHDWLTQRFAEHRGRLMALAYRMLGSGGDAEDGRREERAGARPPEPAELHASLRPASRAGPEDEALLADSVGAALMVVLDALATRVRLADALPRLVRE